MAALIATHNLELAARMDRVVKLENGRIVSA
jgi:lipoprotein-releasing system ATP-binding protein